MDDWLSTDEHLEAVLSLEMVSDSLPKVLDNVYHWKWVIIALHMALQGYMVLALKGTNSFNVLEKKCRDEWEAAWKRNDGSFPVDRLDNFLSLYKKIKAGRKTYEEEAKTGIRTYRKPEDLMLMGMHSQPFKPRGTQNKSVEMLHHLRNDYIHFPPKGWLLGVHGLPRMVDDCVGIIDFLAFECGNVLWHDKSLEAKTRDLVRQIRSDVAVLKEAYAE
ncbi:MAG: hypothetical protein HY913_10455 [Desulfomonile tiedjei]|nr:hypothetical protein [Desulfomonile tiedjei]